MAVRTPLYINSDGDLQEMTTSMINVLKDAAVFHHATSVGTSLAVVSSGGNLGTINEGELFGEISSLFNKEHSVSAEAASECRLLIIEKDLFYNKVQNADPIIKAIIRTITGRLHDMNEKTEKIWKELHFLSSIKIENEN